MTEVVLESLQVWAPEAIVSLGALLAILAAAWRQAPRTAWAIAWLSLAAAAGALATIPTPPPTATFFGLILCDLFSLTFRWFALGAVALTLLLAAGARDFDLSGRGEGLGLLLLAGVGLMLMAEAGHLLMAAVAMELVSLASYVLVGFGDGRRGAEASLKYLLFGAVASGIMLFGMSLLIGLTGQLSFSAIAQATAGLAGPARQAAALAGLLLLAGLAFKISLVPFHLWTPDAYEGAPIAVTAFLSVGPKAAGLALLLRIVECLQPVWPLLAPILLALTVATMTLGNLVALVQTNVKRLLAYSTIGQVGYLLIGLVVGTPGGRAALLVYLIAYLFMNVGVFAVAAAVVNATGRESLEAFRGLSRRAPALALFGTIFLLSLAGIPPLLGFFGKFLLVGAALEVQSIGLALVAVANSAVALYYYVNLIRWMYVAVPVETTPLQAARSLRWAVAVCAVATVGLGLFPAYLLELMRARTVVNLL